MAKSKAEDWLTEDGLALLECWARDGLTDEQIADNMEIDVRTLYRWKNKHSQICQSLKKNKGIADYQVQNALFKSATGYTETHTTQKVTKDGDVVDYEVTTYYPPNPTSIIYWLKNRKPNEWRDKQQEKNDDESNKKVVIVDDLPKW